MKIRMSDFITEIIKEYLKENDIELKDYEISEVYTNVKKWFDENVKEIIQRSINIELDKRIFPKTVGEQIEDIISKNNDISDEIICNIIGAGLYEERMPLTEALAIINNK